MTYKPYSTTGNKGQRLQRTGFSLIELIVAVSLFTGIMLSSTSIFKMVIDSQRSALAAQNVQESLKYFLEVTAKEIRMAQKNEGICLGISPEEIYAVSEQDGSNSLSFRSYYDECVTYSLVTDGDTQRFRITRNNESGFISPAAIYLDNLKFVLSPVIDGQPMVTMSIKAHALGTAAARSEMTLQTSITSRYYR